ncbi:MAG: hypothetical protein M1118_03280 [Chloroflexi bacterium]|nr:hypothetical protein [Chloroflexota bacterium]
MVDRVPRRTEKPGAWITRPPLARRAHRRSLRRQLAWGKRSNSSRWDWLGRRRFHRPLLLTSGFGLVLLLFVLLLHRRMPPASVQLAPSARLAAAHALAAAGYETARSPAGNPAVYLLTGSRNYPQKVAFLATRPGRAEALYVAQLDRTSPTVWRLAGIHRDASTMGLHVTTFTRLKRTLFYTLADSQLVTVLVARDLTHQRTQMFQFTVPATAVQLSSSPGVGGQDIVVSWRSASGQGVEHLAVLQGQADGWRSTTAVLTALPTTARGHPLFIQLVEATRHWFGPHLVAQLENGWYSLADLVQRRVYWFTHAQPAHASPSAGPGTDLPPTPAAGSPSVSGARTPAVATPSPAAVQLDKAAQRSRATQKVAGARPSSTPTPSVIPLPSNLVIPQGWPQASGEGVWAPVGRRVAGQVVMERTFVLPDPQRPYARVDLVWINPALAHVHLVAGTRHPHALSGVHGQGEVPLAARPRLLAAFNGGFKRIGGHYATFGFRAGGLWYRRPSPGLATLAVYPSGRVVLGAWGRDLPVTSRGLVSSAEPLPRDLLQNLLLLVDRGRISPQINHDAAWGETVHNAVRVWRSGLGQTAAGDLIYAAGTPLTAQSLAQVLLLAGARRAMELDINSYWVTFNFYQPVAPGSAVLQSQKLMPEMQRSARRYLFPDSRDFAYLTAAQSAVSQPTATIQTVNGMRR